MVCIQTAYKAYIPTITKLWSEDKLHSEQNSKMDLALE